MENRIKNIKLEKKTQDDKDMALVRKSLQIIRERVEYEVGKEPEEFEELDIRCEAWKAFNYLNNFFK